MIGKINNPSVCLLQHQAVIAIRDEFNGMRPDLVKFDKDAGTIVILHPDEENLEVFRGLQKGHSGPWICRLDNEFFMPTDAVN